MTAPNGKPTTDAFGNRHDVGLDAGPLTGKQFAAATDTRLHLVHDKQKAMLVAQIAQPAQKVLVNDPDAAFALDRFDHNRRGLVRDGGLNSREITDGKAIETRSFRAEPLQMLRISGSCYGGQCAAVETPFEGDDARSLRVAIGEVIASRQLDRALAGFRSRIAEEDAVGERGIA